ncbi:MAG TPA: hypothetical protein VH309_03305 [Elusimicrobiota bacterium]|jgi:hypothetical protein|nr:hypothetical protein [Elusimicrobiota bacterium]
MTPILKTKAGGIDSRPAFQISRGRIESFLTPGRARALRAEFARSHVIRLPGLLEPALLRRIQQEMAASTFYAARSEDFDRRCRPKARDLDVLLTILLNAPTVFRAIESLTGLSDVRGVSGRVYRMLPRKHRLDWHGDNFPARLCALTVNVAAKPFKGGAFQLRRKPDGPISSHEIGAPGDGLLFRISPELIHRSAPVLGRTPKDIFACFAFDRTVEPLAADDYGGPPR